MIYFDNSATGGFKPNSVIETATNVIKYLNANPGRSGHRLSLTGAEFVFECRKKVANLFNSKFIDRVIFTKNCTEALNLAILGTIKKGGNVITTIFEHNSVLRPLQTMRDNGDISLTIVEPKNSEFITLDDIIPAIKQNTYMVAVTSASNVTGCISEIHKIGEYLKDTNIIFLVDGAQGGGHIPLDITNDNIDILCLAGHKGLYSIQGVGILLFNDKTTILPIMYGGTGTDSFNQHQPSCYPESLESGTLNLPGICSLSEGVNYINNNLQYFSEMLNSTTSFLISELSKIDKIKIYSKPNPVGIVSFSVENTDSNEVSEILSNKYDIAIRGGFHCAPLVHKYYKTDNNGLCRVSLCPHNTKREILYFINAMKEITINL